MKPLPVILVPVLLATVSFAIDMGYVAAPRSDLQNSADSAALAGAPVRVRRYGR